jgi:hypothetical protein
VKIITLCGSTRFKDEFYALVHDLTLQGNVVLSLGFFSKADGVEVSEEQLRVLKKVHFKKIDLADEVMIVNVGGYIGEGTEEEIEYAKSLGKKIVFLEAP